MRGEPIWFAKVVIEIPNMNMKGKELVTKRTIYVVIRDVPKERSEPVTMITIIGKRGYFDELFEIKGNGNVLQIYTIPGCLFDTKGFSYYFITKHILLNKFL